jgi:hypothetical protein
VVTEVTPALGFAPAVRFSGLLDGLPDQTAQDLLAVLREALNTTWPGSGETGHHRAGCPGS